MAAANIPLSDCIDTIIDSLPVCKVRGVAYATFTVISINERGEGYLVEYDNPPAIYIRDGELIPPERTERIYADKKVYFSPIKMREGDQIITTSDGVVHAGIGMSLNFGWDIAEIREFMEIHYDRDGAAMTAASVLANACYSLYGKECGDDTSVLCVKLMPTRPTNIMIGPPRDELVVGEFLSSPGKHAVCGGTSSQVVARVMGKELTSSFDFPDRDVPPIGYIDGIDLVCEGVLTLRKGRRVPSCEASSVFEQRHQHLRRTQRKSRTRGTCDRQQVEARHCRKTFEHTDKARQASADKILLIKPEIKKGID